MQCVGAFVVVLVQLEIGEAVVPAPLRVTRGVCPALVIARLAAHINHAVDAAATAQGFATRINQASAVEPGFGLGFEHPVGTRVADAIKITHRDMNPVVIITQSRFDQQYSLGRVGAQAVG